MPAFVFCGFHRQLHSYSLQLLVYIDGLGIKVYVLDGQTAKFRYSHPRMEQDIDDLIIFAVADVVLDKLKEASHLFPGNCL